MTEDRQLDEPVRGDSLMGKGSMPGSGSGAQPRHQNTGQSDADRQQPLWRIAWSLMPVLPLLTLSVAGSVIFLASLPLFAGQYFAVHVYGGSPTVDCASPTLDPMSTPGIICYKGFGRAGNLSGDAAGVAALLTFLLAPAIGQTSDRYGRKWFLVASQILAGIPFVLMYLSVHSDGAILYPYYVFTGIQGAISLSALCLAFSADKLADADRSAGFGMIIGAVSVALIVGPLLSAYVTLKECTYAGLAMAIFSVVWSLFIPESLPESRRRTDVPTVPLNPIKPLLILTRSKLFLQLTGAVIGNSICENAKLALIGLYVQETLHWTNSETNVFISVLGAVGFLAQGILLRPMLKLLGASTLFKIGIIGTCLDTMMWGLAGKVNSKQHSLAMMYVSTVFFAGLGYFAFPSVSAIKSNNSRRKEQGQIQGALFGARTLASGGAQFAIPHIYSKIGLNNIPTLLLVTCVFGVLAFLIALPIVQTDANGAIVGGARTSDDTAIVQTRDGDLSRPLLTDPDDSGAPRQHKAIMV